MPRDRLTLSGLQNENRRAGDLLSDNELNIRRRLKCSKVHLCSSQVMMPLVQKPKGGRSRRTGRRPGGGCRRSVSSQDHRQDVAHDPSQLTVTAHPNVPFAVNRPGICW